MVKRTLDPERDLVKDDIKLELRWTKAGEGELQYDHRRPLPTETAQKALDYIHAITKQYPFQIRYAMAKPLWARFAQEWCDSGDEQKALRSI